MMIERDNEHEAVEAIRKAFPADAGLSAEKTRELYADLRSVEVRPPHRAWTVWAAAAAVAVIAVGGVGTALALHATQRTTVPPRVASAAPKRPLARPKTGAQLVPALALKAITASSAEVLHFTSVADKDFGPDSGHSTEEMWFEPASGRGRLVRKDMRGDEVVLTRTIVSDGSAADVIIERPGEAPVTQPASAKDVRSLDKLSAYRKMLESDAATVTARETKDGQEVYKVRAVIRGFGRSEFDIVMEAEVRASDYLPLNYSASLRSPDGKKTMQLSSRTFSRFERLKADELPSDWFQPKTSGKVRDDAAEPPAVEI